VITVVIGILNGTDIWDPPRNTLLTHVHAGTLGWITLSVFGGAIWMFGAPGDPSARLLANSSIAALSLYVLAFWSVDLTTSSVQRPIGGTLAFIAIVWVFVWVLGRKRRQTWDVAEFGMALALFFLVIGAILGVLLGLQLADVEIVAGESGQRLGDAHPAAMVVGYVILAAVALIEWVIRRGNVPSLAVSRAGMVQMLLIFLAGLFAMVGVLIDNEMLLQLNVPFEVVGVFILVWRLRSFLAPREWGGPIVNAMMRLPVVGLIVGVLLFARVVALFVSGADFEDIIPWLLAVDHVNFIAVVTNLVFAMLALSSNVSERANRVLFWGVAVGIAGFAPALITDNATLKRIFTPILGLALLHGIYSYLRAESTESVSSAPV
jgi:hypothetical protein